MKTKFSELVKVKKQKVQEIENSLRDARARKQNLQLEITDIISQMHTLPKPPHGEFSTLQLSYTYLEQLKLQKEQYEIMLKQTDVEIQGLQELYKEANIGYEKVLYLHDSEVQKELIVLKQQENREMDEIANQLFMRKVSE